MIVKKEFQSELPEHIFRAYDIRGLYPKDLNPDVVFNIGLAFGTEALIAKQKQVIIARDGRLSGYILAKSLIEGLQKSGCNVVDIGEVPTPVLYFAVKKIGTGTGIMLTGSHNPMHYNGLKMTINNVTLSENYIQRLKQRIKTGKVNIASDGGTYRKLDVSALYIDYICKNESLTKKFNIVVDAGNGIAGDIAIKLYRKLGCSVEALYCKVDGTFPNHHPDPSKIENLKDLITRVQISKADVGLAFDGDGDRLGVITPNGKSISPDRQLMLYAKTILKTWKGASIIYDVKCSKNMEKFIKDQGGNPIMSKTGHAFIKNKMSKVNAILSGEMSGHIFFNDRWLGFDDGLYTGVRLLQILSSTSGSLDDIFAKIPQSFSTPEINIKVSDTKKFRIVKTLTELAFKKFRNAKIITIDGVRVEFNNGWGLVRASNTMPCLVLRFEADTKEKLAAIQINFMDWVNDIVKKF
jgi:phosphomannomutase/phosphoglucomutase